MRPLTFTRLIVNCLYLAVILFVVMVIALKLGAVPVSLYGLAADLLQVLFHRTSALSSNYDLIVIDIRLPRILLGIVVGASLSVAGTAFQALLRNPLADPYILGASSGASLGAILTLIVQPYIALPLAISVVFTPVGAFVGAAVTIAAVYFLGRRDGTLDSNTLLLSGIVSGSFLSAIIMFLDVDAGGARRFARNSVLADGRSFDDAAAIAALGARRRVFDCERRDLFDGV